jgi:hypothetical protein
VSYELFWKVHLDWVIDSNIPSVPTARGATSLEEALQLSPGTRLFWQNQTNRLDVNGDGLVTPLDVLITINRINDYGTGLLRSVDDVAAISAFLDVNGDGFLTRPILSP